MRSMQWYTMAVAAGLLAPVAVQAEVALKPATLIIEDGAGMFSDAAKEKAKQIVREHRGAVARDVHIETYTKLSEAERKEFDALEQKKDSDGLKKFWSDCARSKAVNDKGVLALINRSPGHVHVLADRATRDNGFILERERDLAAVFLNKLKESQGKPDAEAQKLRDEALISGAEYLRNHLPTGTTATGKQTRQQADREGSGIGKWLCIGLCVLLGVWLVIGLIRAFSGGGGGGAGGTGGGGGGFGSSLLGGLFGAMAGMWLYNNLFGGSTSSAFGGDSGGYGCGVEAGTGG